MVPIEKIVRRPALSIALIIAAVSLAGSMANWISKDAFATDFSVYWRAANEPLSTVYLPGRGAPFPYQPTMLFWVSPLAAIPLWPAFFIWIAGSASALFMACRSYMNCWAALLVLLSPPLVSGLATGQVSPGLAALLLWACGTSNRVATGIALGVIASIKPQLVLMAPVMLLASRDWKAFAASATTFGAIVLLSLIIFGPEIWWAWVASLDGFRAVLHDVNLLQIAVTPAAVAERYGLPVTPFLLVGIGAGAWLAVRCRNAPPLEKAAAISCASLLAAPYALVYDLAAIIPFLVWSVVQGRIAGAIAMAGALNPIPLMLTSYLLVRAKTALEPAVAKKP